MDNFGPSLIYGLESIVRIIPSEPILHNDLVHEESPLLFGNSLTEVLAILEHCRLIFKDGHHYVHITERGKTLAALSTPLLNRELILLLIEYFRPPWTRLVLKGRKECLPALPSRVCQCMEEAGLAAYPVDENVMKWWRRANIICRNMGGEISSEVGNLGEELSIELERNRTKSEPQLIALESTRAGYDILSRVDAGSIENLRIEVKASSQKKNDAFFFVTENEWRVALSRGNYLFHLWLLLPDVKPRIAFVPVTEIAPHIASNNGSGRWTSTKIPFKFFSFQELSTVHEFA